MKPGGSLKRLLHWVGSGLALVGIAFVAFRLHTYWGELNPASISAGTWVLIVVLIACYAFANILLGSAWFQLIHSSGAGLGRWQAVRIYGISQLAKYLPGNIFHLAGRQALGLAAGVSGAVLARSTLAELLLIAVSGAIFATLALPLVAPQLPFLAGATLWMILVCGVATVLRRLRNRDVANAFLMQTLFLMLSGALFVALLAAISSQPIAGGQWMVQIGGAYVVAWLGGFVTPGAPAGLGVRELILLFLFKGNIPEADLLLATLLGRLVTVAGDVLFFLASLGIREKYRGSDNE